jgi:hypothetical protein
MYVISINESEFVFSVLVNAPVSKKLSVELVRVSEFSLLVHDRVVA